jgi:hypothetical protein
VRPPARKAVETPGIQLALPAESGLELVETRHRADEPVQESLEAPRARRVRPPRATIAEEPLQMVETKREDATDTPPA